MVLPLDPAALDVQNSESSSTTGPSHTSMRRHNHSNDPRPSPSNMCKSGHNFRKMTIPWSSTALDQQNPKKFETKKSYHMPPHAFDDTDVHCFSKHMLLRATCKSHTLKRAGAQSTRYAPYAHAMMSWMMSLWRHHPLRPDPFFQANPVWPTHPDPVRTACKKN